MRNIAPYIVASGTASAHCDTIDDLVVAEAVSALNKGMKVMAIEKEKKSKIQVSQVLDLLKLVEYGQGAIVSRTLVENDAGTVTLFAFDADQGLSEHTAPFDALVQVVDGQGEFIIDGESHQVGEGQLILMPANIPHAVRANRRFKMMLTMLRK